MEVYRTLRLQGTCSTSLHVLSEFGFSCLSVKYRASLRVCASQRPDYGKGTSAGAIWPCLVMAHRLLDIVFSADFCLNFIMDMFFDIFVE
jgi:hypothetical protein